MNFRSRKKDFKNLGNSVLYSESYTCIENCQANQLVIMCLMCFEHKGYTYLGRFDLKELEHDLHKSLFLIEIP